MSAKNAVVTGADSGIGNAFAQLLLKEGYTVYAVDRNLGNGLKSLRGANISAVDVTSEQSIKDFKETIKNEPVDLLLNIAGL